MSIIFFVLSCIVSLYATEIKLFLRNWPKDKFRKATLNRVKSRLRLLNGIHGNSYELTLWFIWELVDIFIWTAIVNIITFLLSFIIHPSNVPTFWSTATGVVIGRAFYMKDVLRQLYNYKASVQELLAQVVQYEGFKNA